MVSAQKYILPPPNVENDGKRLDLQHQLWLLTLKGRLLNAPTQENGPLHRVLDLGTGTGIWATEFATKNPATVVYGMDIFAPSPPEIPPNCKFIAGDVTADWKRLAGLYSGQGCGSSEHFDFIHSRMLLLVCPNQDLIIQNCFDNLRPGGIVEFQEMCQPIRSDLPPECLDHSLLPVKWSHYAMSGTIALGVDCTYAEEKLEKVLRQIGFVDIEIKKYRWPFGSWMANECQSSDRERLRMMGDRCVQNLSLGLDGISKLPFTKGLQWEQKSVNSYVGKVRKTLGEGRLYVPVMVAWARRPH